MSNTGLAAIDARIHAALKRAGLADGGTSADDGAILRRKNGEEVPCRVIVTRNAQRSNEQGRPVFIAAVISVLLADTEAAPVKFDAFVLGDDLYTVDRIESQDESQATCLCRAGR